MSKHINSDKGQPVHELSKPARLPNGKYAPGSTGNPKGRPRKPKGREMLPRIEDLYNVLSTEMLKEHEYKVNGQQKSLPYIILLLQTLKIDALKGDKSARKTLIELWKGHLMTKYKDKMEFFQVVRDADVFNAFEVLELNEKM